MHRVPVIPLPGSRARQFGAGLISWDDILRDVDVRLRPVFDFNVFLVVGDWLLVAAVAIVGLEWERRVWEHVLVISPFSSIGIS